MLIDGELVEAASGKRFDNINPATEEVLGQVADASAEDMGAAIAAARRAFDETDWSTNHAFRRRASLQLQAAIESEQRGAAAPSSSPRSAAPIMLTYGPQLDAPLGDALRWPAQFIDQFEWSASCPTARVRGQLRRGRSCKEAAGVVGAIVPWNYPFEVIVAEGRPGARHRQHRDPQARARHAVERHPPRPARRREDRHPARRVQRRHVVRPPRRRGAHHRARSSTSSRSPARPPPASASSRRAAPR